MVVDDELVASGDAGSLDTMGGARRRWCGLTPIEGDSRSSEASPLRTCLDKRQGSCFIPTMHQEPMSSIADERKGRKSTDLTVGATIDMIADRRIDGPRRRRTAAVSISDKMRVGNETCGVTRCSGSFPKRNYDYD